MLFDVLKEDKSKIAIVVVGYNRIHGLKRLLENINTCNYPDYDVPLVISIDASENEEVYDYVRNYKWDHGTKYVNIEEQRLGLKKHILQCGSLTRYFKAVIILEDDLYLSPFFYDFSETMVDYYGKNNRIAGISLYTPEINDHIGLPFRPLNIGHDVFAWQRVNTWGQIWTKEMWDPFISWYQQWNEDFSNLDIPRRIKNFTRAWSKYLSAFSSIYGKFYIYPYESLITNFNDLGGEHSFGNVNIAQVSLLQYKKKYKRCDFENLVKYDIYGQNLEISSLLGLKTDDIVIDLYGLKEVYNKRFVLCPFNLPYKMVRSFGVNLRPIELNIMSAIDGDDLFLYDRELDETAKPPSRVFKYDFISYYLQGFSAKFLLMFLPMFILKYIRYKMKDTLKKKGII